MNINQLSLFSKKISTFLFLFNLEYHKLKIPNPCVPSTDFAKNKKYHALVPPFPKPSIPILPISTIFNLQILLHLSFISLQREREQNRMGVVVIDGSTVRDFVNDEAAFAKSVDEQFGVLDLNNDGVLSRSELRTAFESMRLIETHFGIDVSTPPEQLAKLYDSIFDKFDGDRSGAVDRREFRDEMRKIMLAIADGLGSFPIRMVLEDDPNSLLQKAADLEASKT